MLKYCHYEVLCKRIHLIVVDFILHELHILNVIVDALLSFALS